MLNSFFRRRKLTKEERIAILFVKAAKKSARITGAKSVGVRRIN
ncbi:hypothetical protein [Virgibacillus sp. SK37]|nr:hypothetical protein [Virgibacillus sp. SK37]